MAEKPSVLGSLSWGSSADSGLSEAAQARLFLLDQVLGQRKLKGTLTSGRRRPDGTKSHHHEGNAVDFVVAGDMRKVADELKGLGFRAEFERTGQRNPNGSVASGDHIHVTLIGDAPKARGFDGLFAAAPAQPKAKGFDSLFTAAVPPPAPRQRKTGGFDDLFAAKPAAPRAFNPLATPDSDVEAAAAASRGAKPFKPKGPLDYLQYLTPLSNSYNTWLKQMAREGRRIPSIANDPAGHFSALPGALQRAFTEARASFGPKAVEPTHFREMFGAEKGKTGRGAYNTLAVLDYVSSMATDPTNAVGGLASKAVGKGLEASGATRVYGNLASGAKAQVSAQHATRARKAAEASYASAKAKGAGKATLGELGRKVTQARATERNAIAAANTLAGGSRAANVGVKGTRLKPVAGVVGKELDAQAAMRQSKTKAVQGWLNTVGHAKGALLTNPATTASNALGTVVMAETELTRAGVGMASFLAKSKSAKAQLDAYRKTGQPSGDIAELLAHAPGVLDTPAVLGASARSTRNPALRAQQQIDEVAKVNLFLALKPKLGAAEAAKRVKTGLFDYSDVPALVRAADQYGLVLFGSFGHAAGKAFLDTLVKRPDLIARYPRLQKQLLAEFPGSEEEFEKLQPWQRTPLTLPVGKGEFVNLMRYHPLGQFFADSPMGTGRPAEPMDIVGRTAAGPLLRAAEKAAKEKDAPAEDQWRTFVREAVTGHFPAARDYLRWRAALEGTALSDRRTDRPQTAKVAASQTLGAPLIQSGTQAELQKDVAGEVGTRARAAQQLMGSIKRGVDTGLIDNPYRGEASKLRNIDEGRRAFLGAKKRLREMIASPKNTTAGGKITPGGRGRIRRAYLRALALQKRVVELGRN